MSLRSLAFVWFSLVALYAAPAAAVKPFVDGRWVERHLADSRVLLVDMSDGDTQYQRFHLPGAVRLPYEALIKQRAVDVVGAADPSKDKNTRPARESATAASLSRGPADAQAARMPRRPGMAGSGLEPIGDAKATETPKIPLRLDDTELARLLGRLGITRDKYVIIYDDVGGLNAARLFWELERIGHAKVSVLEGGLVKWILDGRKVVNNAPAPKPVVYELSGDGRANEASVADVKDAVLNRATVLLDVRTHEEYVGDPKQLRTGHVPGARLWPWEQGVDPAKGFVRADEAALRKSLVVAGVKNSKTPIVAYCRSGHRAAQTYLTLRSLGFDDVRVYTNSMNEYELDPGYPLKRGARP
jgi:thiosulfate/3-mercaptopyruvate sulfurtransferase